MISYQLVTRAAFHRLIAVRRFLGRLCYYPMGELFVFMQLVLLEKNSYRDCVSASALGVAVLLAGFGSVLFRRQQDGRLEQRISVPV